MYPHVLGERGDERGQERRDTLVETTTAIPMPPLPPTHLSTQPHNTYAHLLRSFVRLPPHFPPHSIRALDVLKALHVVDHDGRAGAGARAGARPDRRAVPPSANQRTTTAQQRGPLLGALSRRHGLRCLGRRRGRRRRTRKRRRRRERRVSSRQKLGAATCRSGKHGQRSGVQTTGLPDFVESDSDPVNRRRSKRQRRRRRRRLRRRRRVQRLHRAAPN